MRLRGICIPTTMVNPKFIVPLNILDGYYQHMKVHAFICKFMRGRLKEKGIEKWIQQKWQMNSKGRLT